MRSLARATALGAFLAATGLAAAYGQETPVPAPASSDQFNATTFSLSAFGEVRAEPDMANITLGVMTQAKTAQEAMRANAVRMNQVVAALRQAGIAQTDIQTSSLNLSAQYQYRENLPPVLTGYQASNNVTVRVLQLDRLGPAIDAVVGAGANQIHGIGFGLQNPGAAEDEARRKAVQALQTKANLYAAATGYRINRLVHLSEGGGYSSPPPMPVMAQRGSFAKDESTSVSGGEIVVRIDINGLYQLNRLSAAPR